jgi:hypothetical protein
MKSVAAVGLPRAVAVIHSELGLGQDPVARLVEDREDPLIGSSLLGFGRRPEP